MWYTGKDVSDNLQILKAVSSDGANWSSHTVAVTTGSDVLNFYDYQDVFKPSVLLDSGTYKMWYTATGQDGYNRILLRTSTDAVTWTDFQVAIDLGSEGELDILGCLKPMIILDSSVYYLYYIGYDGNNYSVIRASSPDALIWTNFSQVMPAFGIESSLDGAGIEDIFVTINRDAIVPGELITTGQLKIHN
jgi:hypothetical protein